MNESFIVAFVLLLVSLSNPVNCDCGFPGFSNESRIETNDGGRVGSILSSFRERETVYYRCTHDSDIIIGNLNRTCINNEWTGVVPKCASPITPVRMFYEKNFKYFESNFTVMVETLNLLKIVGVRVKINFLHSFNPEDVHVVDVQNIPNHKCTTIKTQGGQKSFFNQTYTFTCFTRTTNMIEFERHGSVLIGFSQPVDCSDQICNGRVVDVEAFQVDTDSCLEPDQPRYGTSITPKNLPLRSGRELNLEEGSGDSGNGTDEDRSRVGIPIQFPTVTTELPLLTEGPKRINEGITVEYVCKPDFIPDNPKRRYFRNCPPGGAWISEPDAPLDDRQKPTCKPKYTCKNSDLKIPPDVIANFTDRWSTVESVAEGQVIYDCVDPEEYKIKGDVTFSKCLHEGKWVGELNPVCVKRMEGEVYLEKTTVPDGQGGTRTKTTVKRVTTKPTNWILIGSVIGIVVVIILVGIAIYLFLKRRQRNYNSEMKFARSGNSNQMNDGMQMSQSHFPVGGINPVPSKRPGIPTPNSPSFSSSIQQQNAASNYLSHNSIVNQVVPGTSSRFTELYSPTYEELNPLTEVYDDEEPGYYSGSNSSKRAPRGESTMYVPMDQGGSPRVEFRRQ